MLREEPKFERCRMMLREEPNFERCRMMLREPKFERFPVSLVKEPIGKHTTTRVVQNQTFEKYGESCLRQLVET